MSSLFKTSKKNKKKLEESSRGIFHILVRDIYHKGYLVLIGLIIGIILGFIL